MLTYSRKKFSEFISNSHKKFIGCLLDARGDGTINVLIGIVIAVVIAGVVIGLATGAIQGIWDALIARIMSLF